jgi:hypothetical protein
MTILFFKKELRIEREQPVPINIAPRWGGVITSSNLRASRNLIWNNTFRPYRTLINGFALRTNTTRSYYYCDPMGRSRHLLQSSCE